MEPSRRSILVAITLLFACAEWLLFEIVRTPYRPPVDMRTFLGREKYDVLRFMGALGAGWLVLLIAISYFRRGTWRDFVVLALVVGTIAAAATLVVCVPPWYVTPLEGLFE